MRSYRISMLLHRMCQGKFLNKTFIIKILYFFKMICLNNFILYQHYINYLNLFCRYATKGTIVS